MNLLAILELLKQALGGFTKIKDRDKWSVLSVQFDGRSVKGEIVEFEADPKRLKIGVKFDRGEDDGGSATILLEAQHHSPQNAKVLVDGELDPDARLVFAFKGGIRNPSRWAFDFKNVTFEGEDYRINLRFDP